MKDPRAILPGNTQILIGVVIRCRQPSEMAVKDIISGHRGHIFRLHGGHNMRPADGLENTESRYISSYPCLIKPEAT